VQSYKAVFKSLESQSEALGALPELDISKIYLLKLPENADIFAAAKEYEQNPYIEYAQPNYIYEAALVPNDPFYSSHGTWGQNYDDMWGLKIIQAENAWNEFASEGDIGAGVVVAVADTGVNYNHQDLATNIWTNLGEVPGNGLDDDGNGFIDDVHGWDFAPDDFDPRDDYYPPPDNNPMDYNGHGTHVAGTIAAVTNNNIGVSGVSWHSSIMPVKGLDYTGSGTSATLAIAIYYAVANGADVINNSWGPSGRWPSDPTSESAINFAHAHGVVVVFAAGNNNDNVMFYSPANSENVITVSSFDHTDHKSDFSNWGDRIDVAAPGGDSGLYDSTGRIVNPAASNILSLRAAGTDMFRGTPGYTPGDFFYPTPGNNASQYYRCLGTSMAAPHVSGLAALILSLHPELSNEDVRKVLRLSADDVGVTGWDIDSGYGRINAYKAVALKLVKTTFSGIENIISGNVKPAAANYVEITPATSGPLKINFNGNDASTFMVNVELVKNGSAYGTNSIDLNTANDGDYWIYQTDYYERVNILISRNGDSGNGQYAVTLSPDPGYQVPPFTFSDVIDSGDSSWASPYHTQLRITAGEQGLRGGGQDSGESIPTNLYGNISSESVNYVADAGRGDSVSFTDGARSENSWVDVGRGRDYLACRNTLTGEYKQVIYPGPIHTWNGTRWVSYVLENKGEYIQIQHPIASARFYLDRTEFWDENFENCVVVAESWVVEWLKGNMWQGVDFSWAQISHEILSEDEVRIVRTENSALGILKVTYIFTRGSPLKITSEFTSHRKMTVRFAWRPKVEGATSHQVTKARLLDINSAKYRGSADGDIERNVGVSFFHDSTKSLVNFSWYEEAENEDVLVEVDATNGDFLARFGNFDLDAGQTVVLDPTVGISPNHDASVYYDRPDLNEGPWWYLDVCDVWIGYVNERHSFLKFSLSGLPSEAIINSAGLDLFAVSAYPGPDDARIDACEVTDDSWHENTITWNTMPDIGNVLDRVDVRASNIWYEWNVTSFVESQYGGDKVVSLCMIPPHQANSSASFVSKDHPNNDNHPYLEVTYIINNPPNVPTSLRCEGQTNPTRVTDTTPEFSAIYNDPDAGDTANYYRIQVDDQSNFSSPHWDSGKTSMPSVTVGNRCSDISYSGPALTRGMTYYWQIKFWDVGGLEGDWSTATATFRLNQLPNTPRNPNPENGATGQLTSLTLSWLGGDNDGDAVTYFVYFGTSSNPPYVGSTTSTSYPRSGLAGNTTYYWKIVAGDGLEMSSGPVWWFKTQSTTPNVQNAWVYWRFDNSVIDDTNYDNWVQMVGQENITGIWRYDISRFSSDRVGQTIYWRVKARASDGRENWSPVYVGGRLTDSTDIVYQGFETGPANAVINETNWGCNQWYYKTRGNHSGTLGAGAAIDTKLDDTRRLFVNVNFSGKACASITYWYKITSVDTTTRWMRLVGSIDSTNGRNGTWFVLRDWENITSHTTWTQFSADQNLGNFTNQSNCYIKIQAKANAFNQRTLYVDDFTIWAAFLSPY